MSDKNPAEKFNELASNNPFSSHLRYVALLPR